MNHLYIPETDRTLYLPSDLSECDFRQYIEMAALILRYQCAEIDYHALRVQAVYKLLNMKRGKGTIDDDNKFANIYQLSQLIDSFFETNDDGQKVIKQYYINNPLPYFADGLSKFYGPSDEFNNIKFGEYVDGLSHFMDFNATGDVKYLRLLLAVFYRRPMNAIIVKTLKQLDKFNGDVRCAYNPASVGKRAENFKNVHIGIVYGFYLLFASFQKYITTAVLFIENKEIDLSVLFNESEGGKHKESNLPGVGMKGLMYSFAESGIYGDMDKVQQLPLWEALVHMYHLHKKAKDYEANQPK